MMRINRTKITLNQITGEKFRTNVCDYKAALKYIQAHSQDFERMKPSRLERFFMWIWRAI